MTDMAPVVRLISLGTKDAPREADEYMRWLIEQDPEFSRLGRGEFGAAAEFGRFTSAASGVAARCHEYFIEVLAPFGFESGMTTSEAIQAIPENWT